MHASRYLVPSLAASVLLHALVVGLVLLTSGPALRPALVVIPVALVGVGGGGDGGGGEAAGPPATPAADAIRPQEPAPVPVPRAAVPAPKKPRPALARAADRAAAPPAAEVASTGGGEGGGGGGDAPGDGGGSGGARVAYGTNPLPPYPLAARRLGKEGVVLLEVTVAPDGRAAAVRVLKSSGFTPLDESAAKTVRERWRFVPARRGTIPVESRVEVPIRFRLEDARS